MRASGTSCVTPMAPCICTASSVISPAHCGTPAIVVPTGLTDDGLPTALQLDGRAYSENRLLALAVAYQGATAWHTARPEVG